MTDTEINIAIAEACGWERVKQAATFDGKPIVVGDVPGIAQDISKEIPDYCADLNAMHEAVATIKGKLYDIFWENLAIATNQDPERSVMFRPLCEATASQRAEAFLRTLGKWKD